MERRGQQLVALTPSEDEDADQERVVVETDSGFYPPRGVERTMLAAAPDLVRALLGIRADVERALTDDATDETASAQLETIDAALRKAGVPIRSTG